MALYRVPLNDTIKGMCQRVGSPKWNEIKYIRIWWTISTMRPVKKKLDQFARMQFVGTNGSRSPVHAILRRK